MSEIATNRRAFHDYHILDRYEAGIELKGTEVKTGPDAFDLRPLQLDASLIPIQDMIIVEGAAVCCDFRHRCPSLCAQAAGGERNTGRANPPVNRAPWAKAP